MTSIVADMERYFGAVESAFNGLARVFDTEGEWVKRHNLIHRICKMHLDRLKVAHECWEYSTRFWDAFKIDTQDSGFPIFQHMLQLENDRSSADRRLEELPTAQQIRREMVEKLLRYRQHPGDLQKQQRKILILIALTSPIK